MPCVRRRLPGGVTGVCTAPGCVDAPGWGRGAGGTPAAAAAAAALGAGSRSERGWRRPGGRERGVLGGRQSRGRGLRVGTWGEAGLASACRCRSLSAPWMASSRCPTSAVRAIRKCLILRSMGYSNQGFCFLFLDVLCPVRIMRLVKRVLFRKYVVFAFS